MKKELKLSNFFTTKCQQLLKKYVSAVFVDLLLELIQNINLKIISKFNIWGSIAFFVAKAFLIKVI